MKNVLTNLNSHRLYKWIEENMALAQSTTAKELATSASEELGFTVTESNADTARRESGIVMRPVVETGDDTTKVDIRTLARVISTIAVACGIVTPDSVIDIINR